MCAEEVCQARSHTICTLQEALIKRTLEATQTLHSVLQPITPERDVRHNENDRYMVYVPDESALEKSERAGVTHLVHCWTMQGHSVRILSPEWCALSDVRA
jgi:hypothetical protein